MHPWMRHFLKEVENGKETFREGGEWRVSGISSEDDLELRSEWEEDAKVMIGRYVEVREGRGLDRTGDDWNRFGNWTFVP